ncbi:MAG: hypothetical protein LBE86_02680 [Gemmobacter sp.]|jgi:N,N-dimethylformamidase|nr:hypothetical protein [Gemmobacter sp.]
MPGIARCPGSPKGSRAKSSAIRASPTARRGGIELDRYDLSLGTPPHTKIIAATGGHSDNYVLVTEALLYAYAGLVGSLDYRIRGDTTYFTAPNDGAVFCTGAIGYGQALPANGSDNSAAKVLANVVEAFIKDGPLPGTHWTLEEKQWR